MKIAKHEHEKRLLIITEHRQSIIQQTFFFLAQILQQYQITINRNVETGQFLKDSPIYTETKKNAFRWEMEVEMVWATCEMFSSSSVGLLPVRQEPHQGLEDEPTNIADGAHQGELPLVVVARQVPLPTIELLSSEHEGYRVDGREQDGHVDEQAVGDLERAQPADLQQQPVHGLGVDPHEPVGGGHVRHNNGSVRHSNGSVRHSNGSVRHSNGSVRHSNGSARLSTAQHGSCSTAQHGLARLNTSQHVDQVDTVVLEPPGGVEPEAPFVDGQLGLGDLSPTAVTRLPRGSFFQDEDFPASSESLGFAEPPELRWRRPGELGVTGPLWTGDTSGRVRAGDFHDRWLAEAFAIVAQRPRLLDKVFGEPSPPDLRGVARVRLWRFGRWETVVVDDRLPTPHCIGTDGDAEVWPAVLEKAFAKYVPHLPGNASTSPGPQ
ncbi:hypothetical protein FOCC_FOCC007737 [Frankliniella occidentalis]|nr:hypothetical protein FOCC_FOCC007737 [Frankliniella occidentalis]